MAHKLNHSRPIFTQLDRETENKYAERAAFIPTRALMRAKTWQDVIDYGCKPRNALAYRKGNVNPTRK